MAYGTPADPVGGTVITVAYAVANILDPIRWLRLLTGNADPPGSSYVVISTSTSGTVWAKISTDVLADLAVTNAKMAVGAAVANIGYTPVNRAGDLALGGGLGWATSAFITGASNQLRLVSGSAMFLFDAADQVNPVGSLDLVNKTFAWLGSFSPNSLAVAADATVGGTLGVTGSIASSSTVQGTRLISTIATGTPPLTVASTTEVPNLKSADSGKLNGVAASGYPTLAGGGDFSTAPTINSAAVDRVQTGSYTGNGATGRIITLSPAFTPKLVIIYKSSDHSMHIVTAAFAIVLIPATTVGFSGDATTTNGFIVNDSSGSNTNTHSYSWVALG